MHTLIPAGEGRAIPVSAGRHFTVVNVRGGQVGDLFAFNADDPAEYLSAAHTRAHNWRLFPAIGQSFVTNRRRPVLTLLEDTGNGGHDILVPACDPERYRLLGAARHRSCTENLDTALADHEIALSAVPQPVNLFMPVPVASDATLTLAESPAAAGDRVRFRAELDVLLVVSACPQDLVPLNAGGLSELHVEVGGP
jgi:uncharacterized protein YcgI (DUF1989 family)